MLGLEKKVPKSLKECYETDNVSGNLWSWSSRLEEWGRGVLVILIIVGIISTIADAIQIADVDEDLVFISVITSIITWGLYAFLEYCAYHVLSLLIASLATIVQNTRITANVALYNAAKEEPLVEEADKTTSSRSSRSSGYSISKLANGSDFWICKACGTKNEGSRIYCKDCGKYK